MAILHVEYVGFQNNETSRDYLLCVRHKDGQCDEFVVAIPQQAFISRRARYQDGAEICFMKLSRALALWTDEPGGERPAARQDVTEADLIAYRDAHAPKARVTRPRQPSPAAAE